LTLVRFPNNLKLDSTVADPSIAPSEFADIPDQLKNLSPPAAGGQ
jgi:hypothetical protein